jgi:trigger factor
MKIVSDEMYKYILNEKVNILGEPLPNEDHPAIDFDNDTSFSFKFDLGLSPEINASLSAKDKITRYKIKVDEKMINEYAEDISKRFGSFEPVDEVKDDEMLKGNFKEITDQDPVMKEDASIVMSVMKDAGIKKKFKGAKVGDEITFNLKKAYPNDTEIAALLSIDKETVPSLASDFSFTIQEITLHKPAELNQELFDKMFGEGAVDSEEAFRKKLAEEIDKSIDNEVEGKLMTDLKDAVVKKAAIDLPDAFLKRWIVAANKEITSEQLEEDYPQYKNELKWQVVKSDLVTRHEIKVSDDELRQHAIQTARMQFIQYGMANIPDEHLEGFANNMLAKEEDKKRMYDAKLDEKIMQFLKGQVTISEKEMSKDKYNKMIEEEIEKREKELEKIKKKETK